MRHRQYTAERNPGQFLIDNVTAQGHVVPESEHQLDFPLVEEIQKGAVRDQAQKRMKGRDPFPADTENLRQKVQICLIFAADG